MQERPSGSRVRRFAVSLAATCVLAVLLASPAHAATPPTQPASGPGGAGYQWSGATTRHHDIWWNDDLDYWTLIPTGWQGSGAAPTLLPIVVYNHGWLGYDPAHYQRHLDHLARKGN